MMKIVSLRRVTKYPDRRLYSFSLVLTPFIINGFLFNADKGAILSPTNFQRKRIVRAHGIHWKRLQALLYVEVERYEASSTEAVSGEAETDSVAGAGVPV